MEENLPPGFRFHPTDEELITYYLTQKVSDSTFTSKAIGVVDLNKCEPWDLPGKASMGEKEWYFFSLRDRKYPTGLRTNRATEAGYWKTTGKDKEIYKGGHHVLVGMKKTLVFYKGRAPRGEKSNWVMHEYRLHNKYLFKPSKEEWVVCRVFHKNSTISMKKPQQAAPSSTHELSTESQCDTNSIANELGDIELPNLNNMTNSTSGLSHNISTQSYNSLNNDNNNNNNNNNNLNSMSLLNMNWDANTSSNNLQTHSSWPSSLLNPSFSVNSLLLLKALQLRSSSNYSNQLPRDNATTGTIDYSSYNNNNNMIQENIISPFGQDLSSTSQASSSKINNDILVDTMPQHQQDQPPFNYESIW